METQNCTRRQFLLAAVRCGGIAAGAGLLPAEPEWWRWLPGGSAGTALADADLGDLIAGAPRARYWVSNLTAAATSCSACHADDGTEGKESYQHGESVIKCLLCAQGCELTEGERGLCRARIHVDGELRTLSYGRPISVHIDPIEKKPFYHFLPGRQAYSMATSGCPLRCKFCQNWQISQARPEDYDSGFIAPAQVVGSVRRHAAPIIAFTYNEPTVFTEYLTDIARAGRPHGLRHVMISCGFMQEAPLTEMCEVLDAIKIDLKGFSPEFYRNVCSAELQPVLRSIKQVQRSGTHLEIVNLVVPTLNDSDEMLNGLADWVVGELGPDVPVHYTRFHPDYQLRNLPPTPIATLERARDIARDKGMHHAFVGNVPGHAGNHTYCPGCGEVVIRRRGFLIDEMRVVEGQCESCQAEIAGVWE